MLLSRFLFNIQEDYKYSIFQQCRGEPIKCGQEEGSDESAENVPPSGCIIPTDRDKIWNRIGGIWNLLDTWKYSITLNWFKDKIWELLVFLRNQKV